MMATTSYLPSTNSKYYLTADAGPSPPESYLHDQTSHTTSGSPTPNNVSPTSVTSTVNVRQLRQPRQPMYLPAALRPTESITRPTDIPSRPRPLDTPPTSKSNSLDSGRVDSPNSADHARTSMSGLDEPSDLDILRRGLSRTASESLDEELGDVTGAPTTAHWKPDSSALACYICHAGFTWFFRRHHCRHCGQLVCDAHIKHSVPLDQNARYHPQGTPSKACKACWDEWKIVKQVRHSRTSSIAGSSASSQGTAVAIPNPPGKRTGDVRVGSMARSEGGMVWSTF